MPDPPVDKPVPSEEESGTSRRASPTTPEEIRRGLEEGLERTRAKAHGMSVSEFAASQMAERDALELDNLTRDVEFITGPALSSEVLDYEDLPTMPDLVGVTRGFYASISWTGVGYEWYSVRLTSSGWVPIMGSGGLSSKNAVVGTKTEPQAYHENHITYLPDGLIVRMNLYETVYVFRTTLENTLPRNVIRESPTGDEDTAVGVSWRVDNQGGGHGFILPVTTGVSYNDEGDQKLYGYFVALEVSSDGRIVAVSQEVQYLINAPDAC